MITENQKNLVKAWAKMELNSSYGFPPIPVIQMKYDENKALVFLIATMTDKALTKFHKEFMEKQPFGNQ